MAVIWLKRADNRHLDIGVSILSVTRTWSRPERRSWHVQIATWDSGTRNSWNTHKEDNGEHWISVFCHMKPSYLVFHPRLPYNSLDLDLEVDRPAIAWHDFIPLLLSQIILSLLYMSLAAMPVDPSSDDDDECFSVQLDSSDMSPKASKVTIAMPCLPVSILVLTYILNF